MPLPKNREQELLAELDSARHAMADLIDRVREVVAEHAADAHLRSERDDEADADHIDQAEPSRWILLARTELQQGLMALERAIVMPRHF